MLAKMQTRILFQNLGYLTGADGSLLSYATRFPYFIKTPQTVQQAVADAFKVMLVEENIDIACLAEVDQGSFVTGNTNQIELLKPADYQQTAIDSKYGPGSGWRKFLFTQGKSNGFVAKGSHLCQTHHLESGNKTLLYELQLTEHTTLFWFHFSLSHSVRAKQLYEIKSRMDQCEESILVGDFNIFGGHQELEPVLHDTRYKLLLEEPTYPAHRPYRVFDAAIASSGINRLESRVLPVTHSDHRPIVLELDTP